MIVVDTSALVAVFLQETAWLSIRAVLYEARCSIPAPALVEFFQVATGERVRPRGPASEFVTEILGAPAIEIVPLGVDEAQAASDAIPAYGKGRGNRAQLNVVDLMVYGIAKRLRAPILCTGRDFVETDISIHPASRLT